MIARCSPSTSATRWRSSTVAAGLSVAFDSTDERWGGDGDGADLADGRLRLPPRAAALLVTA